MRNVITTSIIGLALILGACDKGKDAAKADKQVAADKTDKTDKKADETPKADEAPPAPSLDPKVEKAVTVANDISANPDDADAILTEAGLDRESFDKLLYEIARDPELSKSYAIARET